jgi:Tol biopolymer transport system component
MSQFRTVGVAFLVALALAPLAYAQREPVLKQIQVPHHYYYREMYLPQVTSGPSAASWSPDGRELAVSMQGSLWRQAVDTTAARQLTDGPGYDYQPDWSPDGRFIAYASYRDDAVELRMLETATGRSWPLTSNGAVNVEPRFSPDGKRIAFVSTVFGGRFHIHALDVADGKPGTVTRLTEDHESGLPRYYYGPFDHYLSPSWSPDGSELLFVSNRNRIWGSGGFWRMKAEPGAPMRAVHLEETTWRARPDWSRDGKRVVYASYLGGQWHQLWAMTSEGGDVFPLTYGEFDATSPRWSPDGTRIAYVSNETGNTSLWILELPGGARRRLEAKERQYLGPVGRLAIVVAKGDGQESTPARVSVRGPDGRYYAPDNAWRHADDGFDRAERKLEYGYYHWSPEDSALTLPVGEISVEVLKGLEYRPVRKTVRVEAGAAQRLEVHLTRLDDLPAKGWWSGDVHVHMNYAGTYRNDPKHLAFQARAEDVHVIESLIVNKEQRAPDVAYFDHGRLDPASSDDTLIVHGQEYHTSYWGHTGLLGLTDHILMPLYAGYVNTPAASLFPHNAQIADWAHAQGALVGYVHPYDSVPDPTDVSKPLHHEFPVDVALGKVDYYEAVGFEDDHFATQTVWYRLLNCGFRIPAAAGTDAMANYASLHGPVGLARVFAKSGTLDHAKWLAAIKAGRSFATNGPLVEFNLGGKEIGDSLLLKQAGSVQARVALRSIVGVDHLQIIGNGGVVAELPLTGDHTEAAATLPLKITESGFYLVRAFADRSRHPVLDSFPLATTSPIYVEVAGAPARSKPDAAYFLAWVERMQADARAHAGYNSEAEKDAVLQSLAEARKVFEARSR